MRMRLCWSARARAVSELPTKPLASPYPTPSSLPSHGRHMGQRARQRTSYRWNHPTWNSTRPIGARVAPTDPIADHMQIPVSTTITTTTTSRLPPSRLSAQTPNSSTTPSPNKQRCWAAPTVRSVPPQPVQCPPVSPLPLLVSSAWRLRGAAHATPSTSSTIVRFKSNNSHSVMRFSEISSRPRRRPSQVQV